MNQPPREKLVTIDEDATSLVVWTDVPLDELKTIDGVYDAFGAEPGPKTVMCDPRYSVVDIETAICEMAIELEGTDV